MSTLKLVLVTGATGNQGGAVVQALLNSGPDTKFCLPNSRATG